MSRNPSEINPNLFLSSSIVHFFFHLFYFIILLSKPYFHFEPYHTLEEAKFVSVKFTSNQLLIRRNLKWFDSSTPYLDIIISPSHFDKCFLSRVEVNTHDLWFTSPHDAFNFGNLFVRVKCVTLSDFQICSSSARFAITECDFKCKNIITNPTQFLEFQIAKFWTS